MLFCRKCKSSFAKQKLCNFPPWTEISDNIKTEILPKVHMVYDEDKTVIGAVCNPADLLKIHLGRFLKRQDMENSSIVPGNYKIVCKVLPLVSEGI